MESEKRTTGRATEFMVKHNKALLGIAGLLLIAGTIIAIKGWADVDSAQETRFKIFDRQEIIKEVSPNNPSLLSQEELDKQMSPLLNRQAKGSLVMGAGVGGIMVGGTTLLITVALMGAKKLEEQGKLG
jgi:hypothetical protein